MELTEEQRKLAAEYEANQKKQLAQQEELKSKLQACEQEAEKVFSFIKTLDIKQRKTTLNEKLTINGQKVDKTFSIEYFHGADFHFAILQHREEILKITPLIQERTKLNNLEKIEDSVMLGLVLMQFKQILRVIPHAQTYPNPMAPEARKPKLVELAPQNLQFMLGGGFYMFASKSGGWKQFIYLGLAVLLAFFFLLFRVWPEWLRVGVWYVSWYILVFLIGTAVVRAIVWFALFHLGLDFWIFPNYFIDSDNILDSFKPVLEAGRREDMFDLRMLVLRIASAFAIFFGVTEFMKEPQNLEDLLSGSGEIWDDVFEWGQNKFLGIPDNSTAIEVKKSARQIYAEAFMEDEGMFKSNTQFEYADEDALKEEYEKKLREDAAAEAENLLDIDGEDAAASKKQEEGEEAEDDGEDALDKLLGGDDDEEDEANAEL